MKGWRGFAIAALILYVCAACQQALGKWAIFGVSPDYLLLALSSLCLFASPRNGAWIGFFDGWLHGVISGAHLWQHIALRTLVGYFLARLVDSGIERNWLSSLLSAIAVVILCRLGLLFLAPPSQIGAFLGDTLGTAMYDGVIAIPLYVALNRIVGPRR